MQILTTHLLQWHQQHAIPLLGAFMALHPFQSDAPAAVSVLDVGIFSWSPDQDGAWWPGGLIQTSESIFECLFPGRIPWCCHRDPFLLAIAPVIFNHGNKVHTVHFTTKPDECTPRAWQVKENVIWMYLIAQCLIYWSKFPSVKHHSLFGLSCRYSAY